MNNSTGGYQWIEVSILVCQELAEPVASAFSEIIPGGVAFERVLEPVFPEQLDLEVGPIRVLGYLPADETLEERKQQIKRAVYFLGRISSLPEPIFTKIEEQDWATAWQKQYRPIPLGPKLIVVPSWLDNPTPERTPIFMDPGMAFGSGTHPSTQLALLLLDKCLRESPSQEMIDIGCGSGILSIAAVKVGVTCVLGMDTDPAAVKIATSNAEKNQVGDQTIFVQGSVKELLQDHFPISRAPLVVANIIFPVLKQLLEEGLVKAITSGGNLVLSGVLEDQLPTLLELLRVFGIIVKDHQQQGEWIAIWGISRKA
jgi:ribosomal protein L11 methyltransferase